jgi:hypothetical protein
MKSVSLRSGASKASLASREQLMPSSVLSTFLSSHDQNPSQHQHTPSLSKIPSPNLSPISNPHSPHHLAIQPVPYTPLTLPASQQAPLVAHGITSSIAHPALISSNHPDSKVRWPSGLRRQLKVVPFVVHQYNRWSERAWVQIPLSSLYLLLFGRAVRLELQPS